MTIFELKWPFISVVTSRDRPTGWVTIHARVVSPERHELFARLRRSGARFVGMSSDTTFPRVDEPDPLDYCAVCEAWCHCFREPGQYLPHELPRALISASDFTDWRHVTAEAALAPAAAPIDFVYVGATEPWKQEAKGWALARRCIPRLCDALGLRALVVGAPDELRANPRVTTVAALPWRELLARLAQARFLLLPNAVDASPRILAEALCLDVPVVVNRAILGGWKYVNAFTGVFFDDEDDVVQAVEACLATRRSPQAWFRTHHGPYHAGRRLLELLAPLDPTIAERSHLGLAPPSARPAAPSR